MNRASGTCKTDTKRSNIGSLKSWKGRGKDVGLSKCSNKATENFQNLAKNITYRCKKLS